MIRKRSKMEEAHALPQIKLQLGRATLLTPSNMSTASEQAQRILDCVVGWRTDPGCWPMSAAADSMPSRSTRGPGGIRSLRQRDLSLSEADICAACSRAHLVCRGHARHCVACRANALIGRWECLDLHPCAESGLCKMSRKM